MPVREPKKIQEVLSELNWQDGRAIHWEFYPQLLTDPDLSHLARLTERNGTHKLRVAIWDTRGGHAASGRTLFSKSLFAIFKVARREYSITMIISDLLPALINICAAHETFPLLCTHKTLAVFWCNSGFSQFAGRICSRRRLFNSWRLRPKCWLPWSIRATRFISFTFWVLWATRKLNY